MIVSIPAAHSLALLSDAAHMLTDAGAHRATRSAYRAHLMLDSAALRTAGSDHATGRR